MSNPPASPPLQTFVRAVALGAVVGAAVLGIGGRLLMRLVAILLGLSGGFSLGGSAEVIAAGAMYGALAGTLLLPLPPRWPRWHPHLHAAAMLLIFLVASGAARMASSGLTGWTRVSILGMFALLVWINSLILVRVWRRARAR